MGVVAVITNCALIGLQAKSSDWLPEMTPINAVLMFVAVEVRMPFLVAYFLATHSSTFWHLR